ncbi:YadA-like family protein, partial [Moraxella sp. Tifton1]
ISLTAQGLNNGGQRITNVAPGVDMTDAVNVGQLHGAVNQIGQRIEMMDKGYRAGIAGNTAMMNIPQVTRPGANLLGVGLGHYKGQNAIAVGFSSSSDNENIIFKISGSATTQGDYTIGSGLGYQW